MIIEKNTEMLCLRFVDVGGLDCIGEHKRVLSEKGYVWFGKIGIKPSKNRIESLLSHGSGFMLLKKPNGVYLCRIDSFSYESPTGGEYPQYYDNKDFLGMRNFSIWFRILEIVELNDKDVLSEIVIKSSRESFLVTANKSMSSLFYVVNRKLIDLSSHTN